MGSSNPRSFVGKEKGFPFISPHLPVVSTYGTPVGLMRDRWTMAKEILGLGR